MTHRVGQQLGNYRLLRLLGEGGFAEVYLGEHIYLKTQAAIKLLHARLAQGEMESFLAEGRTIAHLKHPNIIHVLEFGVEGGTPFLVMEYAPHGTLRQRHPPGTRLSPATILPYVKQVADALHYAHERKLIHRDIKPENMLLGERGEVLLSDFGIALVAQSSRYQASQEVVGTLAYMAPEQIQGHPSQASDQYALGVVIYEWLSGAPPFQGAITEVIAQHLSAPPPSLQPKVPGLSPMLEQVLMTALAKEPGQRFASVRAFATAFEQAALGNAPSFAPAAGLTPASPLEPTQRVPLANTSGGSPGVGPAIPSLPPTQRVAPASVPGAGAVSSLPPTQRVPPASVPGVGAVSSLPPTQRVPQASVPGVGAVSSLPPTQRVPPAQATFAPPPAPALSVPAGPPVPPPPVLAPPAAPARPGISRRRALLAGVFFLGACGIAGYGGVRLLGARGLQLLDHLPLLSRHEPASGPKGPAVFTFTSHASAVLAVAWSPDGRRIASGSQDKTVKVWDALTGAHVLTYRGHTDQVNALTWSPDGRSIASASDDKTVHVWDAATGKLLFIYRGHTDKVLTVAWSHQNSYVASGAYIYDGTIQIWDAAQHGKTIERFEDTFSDITSVSWSPDDAFLAVGGGTIALNLVDLRARTHIPLGDSDITAVAWSPDGARVADGSPEGKVFVWDARSQQLTFTFTGHSEKITGLSWSPDGKRIASASEDGTVQVWTPPLSGNSAEPVYLYHGHDDSYDGLPTPVRAVAWSPDGKYIASGASDHTVLVWQPR